MKLYAISDLHTDYKQNMEWLERLARGGRYASDALIIAGDVSDDAAIFQRTMALAAAAFRHVWFVAGNHDVWVRAAERAAGGHSLAKLAALRAACAAAGVRTAPTRLCLATGGAADAAALFGGGDTSAAAWAAAQYSPAGGGGTQTRPASLWVFPLLSWYHASFDAEPDVPGAAPIERVMLDFHACVWRPEELAAPAPVGGGGARAAGGDALARHWDGLNEPALGAAAAALAAERAAAAAAGAPPPAVVSFSHFLPRQALLPEKRLLFHANLAKACGSNYLAARLAALRPAAHVYGHTHFAGDAVLDDGVRYVQWPLGYPHEHRRRARAGEGDAWEPLQLFDCGAGAWAPERPCYWSQYYRDTPRRPEVVAPAPWAVG